MAVYKRTYQPYDGALTSPWSRFLILPRFSYAQVFQSRFVVMFFATCFFYPLACAGFIYLSHNLSFLQGLNVQAAQFFAVNERFFLYFCNLQGWMAYLLTALVGPNLISPDLANHALPLYLCRPFSRAEYVTGKLAVLFFLLSLITWIPGLILFVIQCSLAGWEWTASHLWIAGALVAGLLIWITVLSLIALAMSAWVKWRIAAGALILGVFFAGAGFATAINSVARTTYGSLINLPEVMYRIWSQMFRYDANDGLEASDAWVALGVACAICAALLIKKIRAFEVVK
jgi:ABC-2 type transport system permease protein